jgi:hypothetical protein
MTRTIDVTKESANVDNATTFNSPSNSFGFVIFMTFCTWSNKTNEAGKEAIYKAFELYFKRNKIWHTSAAEIKRKW